MTSLTLITAGFVLVTALVIALARSSTARWEEARRSARAPVQRHIDDPLPAPAPGLAGLARAIVRRLVAAARSARSALASPRGIAREPMTVLKQRVSLPRPATRAIGVLRSWMPGGGAGKQRWPKPTSRARRTRDDAAGPARRTIFRRTPSLRHGLRYDRTDS